MAYIPLVAQVVDLSGNAVAGCKAYFYQAGTTTPQATKTDSTGTTNDTNPVIGNSGGIFVTWMDSTLTYKIVIKDSADSVTYYSQDNVDPSTISGLLAIHTGVSDQSLLTTSDVTFNNITATATLTALAAVINGITVSATGASVGQALGYPNDANTLEPFTPSGAGDLLSTSNLSDVASASASLSNLGGQPLDSGLTSIAALGTAADKYLYTTGVDTYAEGSITAFARSLLDDQDAVQLRATSDTVGRVSLQSDLQGIATTYLTSGDVVIVSGRTSAYDGGGGTFEWVTGDQSANVSADTQKGIWVPPTSDTTGASGAWRRMVSNNTYFAAWWGVVGDAGTTDNATALQKCFDWVGSNDAGGIIFLPDGDIRFNSTVDIKYPISIYGLGWGDDTNSANGGNTAATQLSWGGATWNGTTGAAGTFDAHVGLWIKSATASQYLTGITIENLMVNGRSGCSAFIRVSSTNACRFDKIRGRKCGHSMIHGDSANTVLSSHNYIGHVKYTWGSTNTNQEATSHGIYICGGDISGTQSNNAAQWTIERVNGLVYDGYLVAFAGVDNCYAGSIHGVEQNNGGSLLFDSSGSTFFARNNIVQYCNGNVVAETGTYGNVVNVWNSEGGSVTVNGTAQMHYTAIDYITARQFSTVPYKISDELNIPATSMTINAAGATEGTAAAQWGSIRLADGTTGRARWSGRVPFEWALGKIVAIEFMVIMDTANVSKDIELQVDMSAYSSGQGVSTPQLSETFAVTVDDTANRLTKVKKTFTTSLSVSEGESLFLKLTRNGAAANDTASGNADLMSVTLFYETDGPQTAGGGPIAIPPRSV